MLISLLREDPLAFFLIALALIFALVLHELAHGFAALLFGDDTARRAGRLSLNPLAHLDPLGTLLLLTVGFGWAKPVPINPYRFRNYRAGLFVVSVAGIAVNLALAAAGALLLKALVALDPLAVYAAFRGAKSGVGTLALALYFFVSINIVLAVFNLLPIPPLDGSKILQSLLPLRFHRIFWQLERYGWITFLLILTVLRQPIQAVIGWSQQAFLALFF